MAFLSPRIVVAGVVIIAIIFFYPSSRGSSVDASSDTRDIITRQRTALHVLNASGVADFAPLDVNSGRWLNLTGLRKDDGYAWTLLQTAKDAARLDVERFTGHRGTEILDNVSNDTLPLYQNVSGWVLGQWCSVEPPEGFQFPIVNLSAVAPNVSYSDTWERNITGVGGKVQLKLKDEEEDDDHGVHLKSNMAYMSARLTIQDDHSRGDGWEMTLHGVHHKASGHCVLTTTSEKFDGIFALPHFAVSTPLLNEAKALLYRTLSHQIDLQVSEGSDESSTPWMSKYISDSEDFRKPACEVILYLQQHPETLVNMGSELVGNSSILGLIENELRAPTGIHIGHIPPLTMSMVAFSPDCGFMIRSKGSPLDSTIDSRHLVGYKIETFISLAKDVTLGFIFILALQVMLLVRELKLVSTPSMQTRLSFYTVAMLSMGNAFTWVAFLTTAFFSESFYLPMLTVAFFAFLEGSFFGMKFLMEVWSVQATERTARNAQGQRLARNTQNNASEEPPATSETTTDGLPLPVTAQRSSSANTPPVTLALPLPITTPVNQDVQVNTPRNFGVLYTKYYLFLLFVVFLSINAATTWPPWLRSAYANTLSLLYLSFWMPQIYRNVVRNSRRAFSWQFVAGQSILRLLPFAYLWGVGSNVLFVEVDRFVLAIFVVWVCVQTTLLVGQNIIGPRFFVKETWKWIPVAWDYHPLLHDDNLPLGCGPASPTHERSNSLDQSSDERQTLHTGSTREFECAICMQKAKVSVTSSGGDFMSEAFASTSDQNILGRRSYMVTPCRHVFHTNCLESWMKYRLACPICRSHLPQ